MKVGFDGGIKLEFHGAKVTSDGGLLAYRDLNEEYLSLVGDFFMRSANLSVNIRNILRKNNLLEVFDCNIINLTTKILGVVSPHDFDMGNVVLIKQIFSIYSTSNIRV
jgi:hypothetical protein